MWNVPSKERLNKIPRLFETEHIPLKDKLIYLHCFMGDCDWYIAEYDGEDLFWGYAILNGDYKNAEWGYISFAEMKELEIDGWLEVDCEPAVRVDSNPNPRFLRNFPMQANGAEMLRIACYQAVKKEITVCAPIHDAILIEAPLDELDKVIAITQQVMSDASAVVLDGFRLRTDVKIIRHPDRYMDKRGSKMWHRIWSIIETRRR